MATLRIGRANHLDDPAIITAGSEAGSLSAANLKDEDIQKIWRGTGGSDFLIGTASAVNELAVVGLINTNLRATDPVQIRASVTDPNVTSSLSYDSGSIQSGVDPKSKRFVHFLPTAVSYQYVRIDMTPTDTPEAGRMFATSVWAPSRHMSITDNPPEQLSKDFSRRTYSIGINSFTDVKPEQHGWRFILRAITYQEVLDEVNELNRVLGTKRDILVCWDVTSPNVSRDTVWGLMEQPIRVQHMSEAPGRWIAEFEVWNRL